MTPRRNTPPLVRERGKKETVALTVRLPREEWERLHHLAVSEGISIQAIAVRGPNLVFAEKKLLPSRPSLSLRLHDRDPECNQDVTLTDRLSKRNVGRFRFLMILFSSINNRMSRGHTVV